MACPGCLLLFLIGVCPAVFQPTLAQTDALMVFPGQVAQLSCTLSPRHASTGVSGVSWYQQRPGSSPHLLYYHSEENQYRPANIPDRFSATKDKAHNAYVLTINPVQPEDDADYYCCISYSSDP